MPNAFIPSETNDKDHFPLPPAHPANYQEDSNNKNKADNNLHAWVRKTFCPPGNPLTTAVSAQASSRG